MKKGGFPTPDNDNVKVAQPIKGLGLATADGTFRDI